jgi:hypothetical protein
MCSTLQSFQQLSAGTNKKKRFDRQFLLGRVATIATQEFTMSYLWFRSFGRGKVSAGLQPEPDRVNTDGE